MKAKELRLVNELGLKNKIEDMRKELMKAN